MAWEHCIHELPLVLTLSHARSPYESKDCQLATDSMGETLHTWPVDAPVWVLQLPQLFQVVFSLSCCSFTKRLHDLLEGTQLKC